jgi:probable F420-dependent oxidoreductase
MDGAGDGESATRLTLGVNLGDLTSPGGPAAAAIAAEAAGFDVVTAADHVGHASPFVALAAAAVVTSRVRLRTYVLDYGFWNAGLLARDVATLDVVSAGRVEVGLGAGHKPAEHADVGLPFPGYAERLAALDRFAADLRARLDDPAHQPAPVQRPVPVFLAAMSPAGLDVAARHGDLVALSGLLQAPGAPPGTFALTSSEQTHERIGQVRAARQAAGLAPCRFDALVQQVVVDRDPQEVAAEWEAEAGGRFRAAELLGSPFVLFAPSPQEAAAELVRRSELFGITSWCTHAPSAQAFAQVVEVLRP